MGAEMLIQRFLWRSVNIHPVRDVTEVWYRSKWKWNSGTVCSVLQMCTGFVWSRYCVKLEAGMADLGCQTAPSCPSRFFSGFFPAWIESIQMLFSGGLRAEWAWWWIYCLCTGGTERNKNKTKCLPSRTSSTFECLTSRLWSMCEKQYKRRRVI